MHWEWRGMAVNFVLGKAINFGNRIFAYGERKHPEVAAKPFLTHVFHFLTQLEIARVFPSRFSCISPWLGTHFRVVQ